MKEMEANMVESRTARLARKQNQYRSLSRSIRILVNYVTSLAEDIKHRFNVDDL